MKTNRINRMARAGGLAIGLALFAGFGGLASAQDKGATQLLRLSGALIEPQAEPATSKALPCAMCKDEYVSRVDWTARGANKPTVEFMRHLCPGCDTTWVLSGHGKMKALKAIQTCCGATRTDVAAGPGTKQ